MLANVSKNNPKRCGTNCEIASLLADDPVPEAINWAYTERYLTCTVQQLCFKIGWS